MSPAAGDIIGGKYQIERLLAAGGMGSIWVARHRELDTDLAVKFMSEELVDDDSIRLRFKREAKAAAQLKSEHVTQIFDYGVDAQTPYIAMELLVGEDLRQLLRRDGPQTPQRCADILAQVCQGLQVAHDAGIIHRDLKPSNIFLAQIGGREIVKILDFGIAKETNPQLVVGERTSTGVVLGSPRYMSPEQTKGEPVDARSDLWSVAVVAYLMLTGSQPFGGKHIGQVIAAICTGDAQPPSRLVPDLPPELDVFFARALARSAADRFASAAALVDAFSAAIRGELALSVPTPAPSTSRILPAPPGGRAGRADPTDVFSQARPPTGSRANEAMTARVSRSAPEATNTESQVDASKPAIDLDWNDARKPTSRRPLLLGTGAVVLAVVATWAAVGRHEGPSPSSLAAEAATSSRQPASNSFTETAALASAATSSTASSTSFPRASTVRSSPAKGKPRSVSPPLPKPPLAKPARPKPSTDPLFGLPQK